MSSGGAASGIVAHDLVMGAVAKALSQGKNVNQKELLQQLPGMKRSALNSMVERFKKRLRLARTVHETKLSKQAAVQSFVQGDAVDRAASLLLGVAQSTPTDATVDTSTDDITATAPPTSVLGNTFFTLEYQRLVADGNESESVLPAENTKLQEENAKWRMNTLKLQDECNSMKIELQVLAQSLQDMDEKRQNLQVQLENERAVTEMLRIDVEQCRRENEEFKSSASLLSMTSPDHSEAIARLDEVYRAKQALEEQHTQKCITLKERDGECARVRQQLMTMKETEQTLRAEIQQLRDKATSRSTFMKVQAQNFHVMVGRAKQEQAEQMRAEFERDLMARIASQEREHHENLQRARMSGAEAMQGLRARLAETEQQLQRATFVAELRDALISVDEELVALMRAISSAVSLEVHTKYTVQQHITIAGYMDGSDDFVRDMSRWRERRNKFCHERRAIDKLKDEPEITMVSYALCDRLRRLQSADTDSMRQAFDKFIQS